MNKILITDIILNIILIIFLALFIKYNKDNIGKPPHGGSPLKNYF